MRHTDLPPKEKLLTALRAHRSAWEPTFRPRGVVTPGPGQESVWDYPRPPRVEDVPERLKVVFAGAVVADTTRGKRILETAGAPVYHFPPEDVAMDLLVRLDKATVCEWKGVARYFDILVDGKRAREAAYCYPDPFDDLGENYAQIAGWPVFYAGRVDEAWVGEERATPQPGGYYAGWVTSKIVGPIKGEPGTEGW